jgi:hypothetical protein
MTPPMADVVESRKLDAILADLRPYAQKKLGSIRIGVDEVAVIVAALDERALSQAGAGGVVVRPLTWVSHAWGCEAEGGRYRIEDNGTNWIDDRYWLFVNVGLLSNSRSKFATLDEAKAAAQTDYKARILAALAPSPSAGEPRAWIANDPEGGPYLTWSAKAAANYPDPIALYATPPATPVQPIASVEAVRDITRKLEDIADASLRIDGTDIPLGETCREASREIEWLATELSRARTCMDRRADRIIELSEQLAAAEERALVSASLTPAPTQGDGR